MMDAIKKISASTKDYLVIFKFSALNFHQKVRDMKKTHPFSTRVSLALEFTIHQERVRYNTVTSVRQVKEIEKLRGTVSTYCVEKRCPTYHQPNMKVDEETDDLPMRRVRR